MLSGKAYVVGSPVSGVDGGREAVGDRCDWAGRGRISEPAGSFSSGDHCGSSPALCHSSGTVCHQPVSGVLGQFARMRGDFREPLC